MGIEIERSRCPTNVLITMRLRLIGSGNLPGDETRKARGGFVAA
jgi:hypothetical protein